MELTFMGDLRRMPEHFRLFACLVLALQASEAGAAPSCSQGLQPRGGVCVSQKMSDYIECLEASGGNKEQIETEFNSAVKDSIKGKATGSGSGVVIKADGSIELDNTAEQSVAGKMKTKFFSGALAACESVLKMSSRDKAVETRMVARKIDWPTSVHAANIVLMRTRLARSYDTVVSLFDASCPITVWLPMWVWPRDRIGEPVIPIAPTPGAETARSYPFQVKFTRDGRAVNEAGFATRDAPDYELGGKEGRGAFFQYVLDNPDEIEVYLAIRGRGVNVQCGGSIAIEQVPNNK